jgi:hypothetical protein
MHDLEFIRNAQATYQNYESEKKNLDNLRNELKQINKGILSESKAVEREIESVAKKERDLIEDNFDQQIEKQEEQIRRIRAKRNKKKNKKINERVEIETADIREQNHGLKVKFVSLLEQYGVPRYCRSKFYYMMFMTKGIKEVFGCLAVFLLGLIGLPALISFAGNYSFLRDAANKPMAFAVVFAITDVILLLLYIAILNHSKAEYKAVLREGRKIKEQIRANEKQIDATKDVIIKDKDESGYGLDSYDQKQAEVEAEIKRIQQEKQAALTQFETETLKEVQGNLRSQSDERIAVMQQEEQVKTNAISKKEEVVNQLQAMIANEYEPVFGKEFSKPNKMTTLIKIMEEGDAATVEEAIAIMKS